MKVRFLSLLLLMLMSCGRLSAASYGFIALTTGGKEAYLPDPILLVHGVASEINTYSKALPEIDSVFRSGDHLKYGFNDLTTFASAAATEIHGDGSIVVRSPLAGFDYRTQTGQADSPSIGIVWAEKMTAGGDELNLPDTLFSKLLCTSCSPEVSVVSGLKPLPGESIRANIVAHSMGGLVSRAWL